jgi:hypothetical protein
MISSSQTIVYRTSLTFIAENSNTPALQYEGYAIPKSEQLDVLISCALFMLWIAVVLYVALCYDFSLGVCSEKEKFQHQSLAGGRWSTFSLAEQLGPTSIWMF